VGKGEIHGGAIWDMKESVHAKEKTGGREKRNGEKAYLHGDCEGVVMKIEVAERGEHDLRSEKCTGGEAESDTLYIDVSGGNSESGKDERGVEKRIGYQVG